MKLIITDASTLNVEWQKASFSGGDGDCVEVAPYLGAIAIRDSKAPTGPALALPSAGWSAFLTGAKAGEFDHLDGA